MFLPIHDLDNPVRRVAWPFVTHAIIAINVVVYLVLNAMGTEQSFGTLVSLSFKPNGAGEVAAGLPTMALPQLLTAITSMFVQLEFWHLIGNMLCLWVFGDNVEDAMGHAKFALFYLVCGIVAAYAQSLAIPEGVTLYFGASGAVSAVIIAYVMLHPNVRVWVLVLMRIPLRISAMWIIGAWVIYQIVNLGIADPQSEIGWLAHIAGIVTGAALTPLLKRPDVALFDRDLKPNSPSP